MANTLLLISRDPALLRRLAECAALEGFEVTPCTSVCDALTSIASVASPCVVIVDADCCTEQTGPAVRALRARVRAPFVVVFDPGSEATARTLQSDLLAAKPFEPELLARLLPIREQKGGE